jgi:hypothetical protein
MLLPLQLRLQPLLPFSFLPQLPLRLPLPL